MKKQYENEDVYFHELKRVRRDYVFGCGQCKRDIGLIGYSDQVFSYFYSDSD